MKTGKSGMIYAYITVLPERKMLISSIKQFDNYEQKNPHN